VNKMKTWTLTVTVTCPENIDPAQVLDYSLDAGRGRPWPGEEEEVKASFCVWGAISSKEKTDA